MTTSRPTGNSWSTLLRHQGHRLLEAADGREGLAAVRAEHPDLVITDVLMPVMDGYEFVRQLRLDPATSGIPVVFYTAHYGEREARALALSSGVVHVLTKPAAVAEVLRIVGRVLAGEPERACRRTPRRSRRLSIASTFGCSPTSSRRKPETCRAANARLRALINIGLELASERDSGPAAAAASAWRRANCLARPTSPSASSIGTTGRCSVSSPVGGRRPNWIKTGDPVPGILGTVVAERRTMRGDNPGGDPASLQLPRSIRSPGAFWPRPIASPAHVYGWICLVGNEGRTFTEDDEHLVMALSGQVGRIYENGPSSMRSRRGHERDRAQRYLDTAEVILLALDLDGRITRSIATAATLGWTADELLGRDWIETLVRPDAGRTENEISAPGQRRSSIVENPCSPGRARNG